MSRWTPALDAHAVTTDAVGALAKTLIDLDDDTTPGGAADALDLVVLADAIQQTRKTLAELEGLIARRAGRLLAYEDRAGTLPDGRAFTVARGKDRKEWNHGAWQADVRRQVLSGLPVVVDPSTGDVVDVDGLLSAAQAAASAGAPKVTVLKSLGLSADDYCASVPGLWSVRVTSPDPTPTPAPKES